MSDKYGHLLVHSINLLNELTNGAVRNRPIFLPINYLIRPNKSLILIPTSALPPKPVPGFKALKCAVTSA